MAAAVADTSSIGALLLYIGGAILQILFGILHILNEFFAAVFLAQNLAQKRNVVVKLLVEYDIAHSYADNRDIGLLLQTISGVFVEVGDNYLRRSVNNRLFVSSHALRTAFTNNGQLGKRFMVHVAICTGHGILLLRLFHTNNLVDSLHVTDHAKRRCTNTDNFIGLCRHFNRATYHVGDRLSARSRCLIGIRV